MFVAPVVIAAATLNLGNTLVLAGIAFGSVSLVQSLEALFYLVRDGYAGTYYFDTDPIRENPVRECEINIARTKQLLATAQRLVDDGQVPNADALAGADAWWDALVRR